MATDYNKIFNELINAAASTKKHYTNIYNQEKLKQGVSLGMGVSAAKKKKQKWSKITTNLKKQVIGQSKGPVGK